MLLKTYECRRINVEQTLPSRENKNVWEKITTIYLLYHSGGCPLWWLAPPPCPGGKRVTGFSVAQGLPTNPVPLPPRCAGAQQPVLTIEKLMDEMPRGALLSHRLRGEGGGANHQRGPLFHRPTGKSACFPTGESPVVKVLSKLAPLLFEGRLPPPSRRRPVHYKTAVRRDALRFCLGKNYMDRGIAASGTARPVLSTEFPVSSWDRLCAF